MKEENFICNQDGGIVGLKGESKSQHFWVGHITSAIRISINEQRKVEREILKYDKDSESLSKLVELVNALDKNIPILIYDDNGRVILKSC